MKTAKNTLLAGITALAPLFGFSLAGCDNGLAGEDDGNAYGARALTVANIPAAYNNGCFAIAVFMSVDKKTMLYCCADMPIIKTDEMDAEFKAVKVAAETVALKAYSVGESGFSDYTGTGAFRDTLKNTNFFWDHFL